MGDYEFGRTGEDIECIPVLASGRTACWNSIVYNVNNFKNCTLA